MYDEEFGGTSYVIFYPENAKSTEPINFDSDNQLILPHRWADAGSPDIRFQLPEGEAQLQTPEAPHTVDLVRSIAAGFTPDDIDLPIDFDALTEATTDLTPINREHYISATVNRALSEKAGFDALGEDVTPDERERLVRMHQMITSGNTLDSDIGFYRSNPTAMQKLVRFLTAALKSMYARLQARYDNRSSVYLDRIARELSRAKDGYHTRSGRKAFDPEDPDANMRDVMMQLPEEGGPEFYSQLAQTIAIKMPKSATPEQVMQIAASGAKAEEVKWSGLEQALQTLAADGKV